MTLIAEDHPFVESGLPAVILRGLEVRCCQQCGEREIVLPALESIHHQIMVQLVAKAGRLAPEEMRFLRKHAGYSSADMAKRVGVTPETFSRWENGAREVGIGSDRLIRVVALAAAGEPLVAAAFLTMAVNDDSTPLQMEIAVSAPRQDEISRMPPLSAATSAGGDFDTRSVTVAVAQIGGTHGPAIAPAWGREVA